MKLKRTDLQNLTYQAKRIHKLNRKWWVDPRTKKPIKRNAKELLMLVISELSEALEGERKNLMDDHLPHRRMAEVEMADAYIRLMDLSGGFRVNFKHVYVPELNRGITNRAEWLFEIADEVCLVGASRVQPANAMFVMAACNKIIAYCKHCNYDLAGAIEEKLAYNKKRKDHSHKERLKKHGKKF